ncbi:MAG: cation:proton antiporter, partial [Bacillota bacterium]
MNSIFLLLISTYLVIITFGSLFSKYLKLPWMFTVVIYGIVLSIFGVFQDVFQTEQFKLLSQLGMLFFLFTIGLELNLREIKRLGKAIVFGNLALVFTEATLLALLFYFFFPSYVSNNFFVAFIAGLAFGTVGEVLLMAILKEFGVEKT